MIRIGTQSDINHMEKRGKPLLNEWTSAGQDGYVKGQPAEPRVYAWFCKFKKECSNSIVEMKGTVVLLR